MIKIDSALVMIIFLLLLLFAASIIYTLPLSISMSFITSVLRAWMNGPITVRKSKNGAYPPVYAGLRCVKIVHLDTVGTKKQKKKTHSPRPDSNRSWIGEFENDWCNPPHTLWLMMANLSGGSRLFYPFFLKAGQYWVSTHPTGTQVVKFRLLSYHRIRPARVALQVKINMFNQKDWSLHASSAPDEKLDARLSKCNCASEYIRFSVWLVQ